MTEGYSPTNLTGIAQFLYDSGLIFRINTAVLHEQGYAIGVTVTSDGKVSGLNLHHSSDPDGIWFDEETTIHGRRKLRAAGLVDEPKTTEEER